MLQMGVFTTPAASSRSPQPHSFGPLPAQSREVSRASCTSAIKQQQQQYHTLHSVCASQGGRTACPSARLAAAAAPSAAATAAAAAAPQTTELRDCAVALARAADNTKALDISVLHVEPIVSYTSYLVLCTVMSKPQLLAVLGRMEEAAAGFALTKQNSVGSSQWEVLDFGSIVCHVFTPEQREHYNLDDFYALAEEVELPFVSDTTVAAPPGGGYEQRGEAGAGSGGVWSKSL